MWVTDRLTMLKESGCGSLLTYTETRSASEEWDTVSHSHCSPQHIARCPLGASTDPKPGSMNLNLDFNQTTTDTCNEGCQYLLVWFEPDHWVQGHKQYILSWKISWDLGVHEGLHSPKQLPRLSLGVRAMWSLKRSENVRSNMED